MATLVCFEIRTGRTEPSREPCAPDEPSSRCRSLKPTRRTHPAGRSHLGLAGHWLRWGRVGGRAEYDCYCSAEAKMASSLLLSLESRAFSFSICFVRSREALICFSMSGLRRQLSVCKNKRHRGKDEPHAPLLLELEVDACWEGDVVIGAEQGNQGNHKAGMGLDDSLAIKPRAALGRIRAFRPVWRRFGWWNDLLQNRVPNRA